MVIYKYSEVSKSSNIGEVAMDTLHKVQTFVETHPGFRVQIGLIVVDNTPHTYLSWGAINPTTDERWIPALIHLLPLNPNAYWTALNAEELKQYLSTEPERATVLSNPLWRQQAS